MYYRKKKLKNSEENRYSDTPPIFYIHILFISLTMSNIFLQINRHSFFKNIPQPLRLMILCTSLQVLPPPVLSKEIGGFLNRNNQPNKTIFKHPIKAERVLVQKKKK